MSPVRIRVHLCSWLALKNSARHAFAWPEIFVHAHSFLQAALASAHMAEGVPILRLVFAVFAAAPRRMNRDLVYARVTFCQVTPF